MLFMLWWWVTKTPPTLNLSPSLTHSSFPSFLLLFLSLLLSLRLWALKPRFREGLWRPLDLPLFTLNLPLHPLTRLSTSISACRVLSLLPSFAKRRISRCFLILSNFLLCLVLFFFLPFLPDSYLCECVRVWGRESTLRSFVSRELWGWLTTSM